MGELLRREPTTLPERGLPTMQWVRFVFNVAIFGDNYVVEEQWCCV